MVLIKKIIDLDIDEDIEKMENITIRYASRGIITRKNGDIGIFYMKNKKLYKLPGGGNEGNESFEDTFTREVLEETGCKIEILKCMGYTEELKSHVNFIQISYIYVGKVLEETKKLTLTKKEEVAGGEFIWMSPQQAITMLKDLYNKLKISKFEDNYQQKFVIKRDYKILEEYINNK